jgi:ABC-2 type transport system permease protein
VIAPLLARTLRHQRLLLPALLAFAAGLQVVVVLVAASFETGPGIAGVLEMLPSFMQRVVGAQLRDAGFGTFVAFGLQHPALMVATIAWIVVVGTGPAADRDAGTLDLLLARPLPRARYLLSTAIAVALGAVALPLVALLGLAVGLATVTVEGELPWTAYVPAAAGLVALLLCVGGFTLLVSAGARRRGEAAARIVAVLLVLWLLETLADLSEIIDILRWISPFAWFRPIRAALEGGVWAPMDLAVLCSAGVLMAAAAFLRFSRRDVWPGSLRAGPVPTGGAAHRGRDRCTTWALGRLAPPGVRLPVGPLNTKW